MTEPGKRQGFFDLRHPFFKPAWRRAVLVAICLGWATFEFVSGEAFWGVFVGGAGLYCAWAFFLSEDATYYKEPDKE